MKILLTAHQFFPDYASGTEILCRSVAQELQSRGHEVKVFTGFPSEQALPDSHRFDEYDFEGIHVHRFHHAYTPMGGQTSMVELSFDNCLAAAYFEQLLKRYQPDAVHFFHLNRLGTGLIEKAVQANIPAFFTPTDFWSICPTAQLFLPSGRVCEGPNKQAGNCVKHFAQSAQLGSVSKVARWLPVSLANLLVRLTRANVLPAFPHKVEVRALGVRLGVNVARLNQLTKIVAPNPFMRELLIRHGVLPQRVVLLAFGVDQAGKATTPAPQQHHAAIETSVDDQLPRPLQIGFIGTLARHKGCHVLIQAFKLLPTGQALLKIYGNPQDFPDYAAELKQLAGLDAAIAFCGVFPNANIAQILGGLDVLVVPSLWFENTPLVIYSAQAARCPVVAANYPGMSEVISHKVNGLLFKPGDAADLARQLHRLGSEKGLAQSLAAKARPPKSIVTYVDELLALWTPVPCS